VAPQHPAPGGAGGGDDVGDDSLVAPHQRALGGGQPAREQRVRPAGQPEALVEAHAGPPDRGDVEQQVVGGRDVRRRAGRQPPPVEEPAHHHPVLERYLEVRDDRADDAAAAVPGVRGEQQAEPALPRPLVVVDEHEDVVVAGLVEGAVAGGGDAGPRLVDVPHALRR
jgi:hypothetical protein